MVANMLVSVPMFYLCFNVIRVLMNQKGLENAADAEPAIAVIIAICKLPSSFNRSSLVNRFLNSL